MANAGSISAKGEKYYNKGKITKVIIMVVIYNYR